MTTKKPLSVFLLGLMGFYGFFAHGYLESTDADHAMHAARAWWLRGDLGLQVEGPDTWAAERYIVAMPEATRQGMTGENGKVYVQFPIGHQILMVPCVMLGELFAHWFPEPEEALIREKGAVLGEFYWARFFASFLPAFSAAGSTLLIFLLAGVLGCAVREALMVTVAATLCTQFWPACSETMSDQPGLFFLLLMIWLVFRYHAGTGAAGSILCAGLAAGAAVLIRYQHLIPVLVICVMVVFSARRRQRGADVLWLALGALPLAAVFVAANWLRFGNPLETGYSKGATGWFGYPLWLGGSLLLLAPGKGILLFSPPLWLALAQWFHRRLFEVPWLVAGLIFALSVLIMGHSLGWAAGQCWGTRYLTPAVVIAVTFGFALGKPWRRRPRLFVAVCTIGFLVSLGGILSPYRGQQDLAFDAARTHYAQDLAEKKISENELADRVNVHPIYSPIHTHWIYAWLSASGRLERGGSANTTEPLFGIDVEVAEFLAVADVIADQGEDRGFRHWWMLYAALPWWFVLAWIAATAGALIWSMRQIFETGSSSGAKEPMEP